jgi:hypothetical protein
MEKNEILLYAGKILLLTAAVCILLASFFFFNPRNDPLATGFDPRMGQTLVYGGLAVAIALLAWFWPAPGGMIAVLYGAYKLFEHIRLMNIDALAVRTLVPAPAYFTLYALLIIGGILCIIAGWKIKLSLPENTAYYEKIRKAARIATIAGVASALLYGLVLGIILMLRISLYSPDYLLGSLIFLSPLLLIVSFISWKWPTPGGLLTIFIGAPLLPGILSSNWGAAYTIPCVIFCCLFISGGILSLAWVILTRPERKSE